VTAAVELSENPSVVSDGPRAAGSPASNTAIARTDWQAARAADPRAAQLALRAPACGLRGSARLVALGLTAAGAGLLPWLVYLAVSLPASPVAWHWPAAWAGLDGMEAAGLACTGVLMLRRDPRYCLTAAATAALLIADAWFDVTTAPPGSGELTSLLMAVLAELPTAALCAWLARRGLLALAAGSRGAGDSSWTRLGRGRPASCAIGWPHGAWPHGGWACAGWHCAGERCAGETCAGETWGDRFSR
jgi:hypothetical protein